MERVTPEWEEMIDISFLSEEWKEMYKALIKERFKRLS
jgi:hypothetical protein